MLNIEVKTSAHQNQTWTSDQDIIGSNQAAEYYKNSNIDTLQKDKKIEEGVGDDNKFESIERKNSVEAMGEFYEIQPGLSV